MKHKIAKIQNQQKYSKISVNHYISKANYQTIIFPGLFIKMKHNVVGWTSMTAALVQCRFSSHNYQPP